MFNVQKNVKKCRLDFNTYMDELVQKDNPKTVIVEDAVQLDVMPADNDNKTFLVPLPQVPTEK